MRVQIGGERVVQYAAMVTGCLAIIACGTNIGWSSPYLPYLLDENSHIKATSDEASWCAMMSILGAPFGALPAAYLVDIFGRKNFILSVAPISFLSFILVAYSPNIFILSAARFVIGAAEGALYTTLPMYFGEIADPAIRGFVGSSIGVAALIGNIFINCIGPFVSIWASGLICSLIPAIHFMGFVWMPESPYYLLKRGDMSGARKSLEALRGRGNVDKELSEIEAAVTRQEAVKSSSFTDLITVGSNRRALVIYTILCYANKFSGKIPVIFYTTIIFMEAAGSVDPVTSVIAFNVIGLAATIIALTIIDRFGRRLVMLCSSGGCAVALSFIAFYFTAKSFNMEVLEYMRWLPITGLIVYNVIFSFGLSFGPVLYLSELFPTSIKAKALCVADTLSVVMGTMVSQYFHVATDNFGMYFPFWTFAVASVVGTALVYFKVPETKGKTLEQIQLELIGRRDSIKI